MTAPEPPRPFGDFYRGRRVLITGHTGFKGTWLAMWLEHLGALVTGFSTPAPTVPSLFDESGIGRHISSITGDVRDLMTVLMAFEGHRPEIVFHLAAQPLVLDSYRNPVDTFATNVMGTVNVLEAARRVPGVRATIVVTTDKCYDAGATGGPHREGDALGGHDPYSASKAAAELVARAYRDSFCDQLDGHAIATVRAGNIIGGGDWSADRIVPDAVRALTDGRPLRLRHPDAVRPWQHVLDALAGYLLLGARVVESPRRHAGAWNFGPDPGRPMTVGAVVEALADAWRIEDADAPRLTTGRIQPVAFEQPMLQLDTTKARRELGWRPLLSFAETVAMTAEWYRRHTAGDPAAGVTEQQIIEFEHRGIEAHATWAVGEERACAIAPS